MNINWYPGHMKKTRESLIEMSKLVDIVIELIDARAPMSSTNPIIKEITANKAKIILLNKADLADERVNKKWIAHYKNAKCIEFNAKDKSNVKKIIDLSRKEVDKYHKEHKQREHFGPIKAMVVGIPNVGKSTFINLMNNKKSLKTGNKPGVTKKNQWIKVDNDFMLLDTPGVLWPKFESQEIGMNLAFIGSIKDEILNKDDIAIALIKFLKANYSGALNARYKVNEDASELEILEEIAKNRGFILKGNELDVYKAINILVDEFRNGLLGRISLEEPLDE